jgi:hypothetical protein
MDPGGAAAGVSTSRDELFGAVALFTRMIVPGVTGRSASPGAGVLSPTPYDIRPSGPTSTVPANRPGPPALGPEQDANLEDGSEFWPPSRPPQPTASSPAMQEAASQRKEMRHI